MSGQGGLAVAAPGLALLVAVACSNLGCAGVERDRARQGLDLAGFTESEEDLATRSSGGDAGPRPDLVGTAPVDLAMSPAPDLAAPLPDLASFAPIDLAPEPADLAGPAPRDFATTADLARPTDLAAPTDLARPADLAPPPDLTLPRDLATPPDMAGCALAGCTSQAGSANGCAAAPIIGRRDAEYDPVGMVGWANLTPLSNCNSGNNFRGGPACAAAAPDIVYRLFMRGGETVDVYAVTWDDCGATGKQWTASLAIYEGDGCGAQPTCGALATCKVGKPETYYSYVAPHDGWYYIVVDGASANDKGTFDLNVALHCLVAKCGC